MSYTGYRKFKESYYHQIPLKDEDGEADYYSPKSHYYIRVRTENGCRYVNDQLRLSDQHGAKDFGQSAYFWAQKLNESDGEHRYEVFSTTLQF